MKIFTSVLLLLLALVALAAAFLYKGDLPAAYVDQKYANEASRFLETPDGTRIHFRDQGSGPPVVLIHGSNASLHTWEPWVRELSGEYRIITLDLPGHGLTGQVPSGQYGSEAQEAVVSAVVDHLGIETFTLGGNSAGGGVSWRYALAYPERVRAMILVDAVPLPQFTREPSGDEDAETDRSPPVAFALLQQPWFRSIARYMDPKMLIDQGLRSAYNDSPVVDETLIDRYYELTLREGTRQAILERFGRDRQPPSNVDPNRLTQPTLVMWGAKDTLIPPSVARQFHEVLPDSQLVIYDDLGHVPNEEAPTRTARDVRAFLKTVYAP